VPSHRHDCSMSASHVARLALFWPYVTRVPCKQQGPCRNRTACLFHADVSTAAGHGGLTGVTVVTVGVLALAVAPSVSTSPSSYVNVTSNAARQQQRGKAKNQRQEKEREREIICSNDRGLTIAGTAGSGSSDEAHRHGTQPAHNTRRPQQRRLTESGTGRSQHSHTATATQSPRTLATPAARLRPRRHSR
jgi:hypothetical protein